MKCLLLAMTILSSALVSLGQKEQPVNADEIFIRKHNLVTDLERQIKDIPIAAVRVRARYQLASWLWKGGRDDLGKAEEIAAAAIDDHYKHKDKIPYAAATDAMLFNLLDANAKELAKRLREKHKTSSEGESRRIPQLPSQDDSEKLGVDAAVALLRSRTKSDLT